MAVCKQLLSWTQLSKTLCGPCAGGGEALCAGGGSLVRRTLCACLPHLLEACERLFQKYV